MQDIKALIWDLDGPLVDTDLARKRAQTKFLSDCGFSSEEIISLISGWERLFWYFNETEYRAILEILQKEFKCADKLTDEKITWAVENLSGIDTRGMKITENALEILELSLQRNIPMGIVSNGEEAFQWKKMHYIDIVKYFPKKEYVIVKDAIHGKPRPDGILECCKVLQVSPKNTLFIGDRTSDTIAANLAGCISVRYLQYAPDSKEPSTPPVLKIEKAHLEINNLVELFPMLE